MRLGAAALRSPIPVRVDADGIGRYPPEVESAVYFCCLEAMQNAIKHGDGASLIAIALSDDGRLRFEVADNGRGFDVARRRPGRGARTSATGSRRWRLPDVSIAGRQGHAGGRVVPTS